MKFLQVFTSSMSNIAIDIAIINFLLCSVESCKNIFRYLGRKEEGRLRVLTLISHVY